MSRLRARLFSLFSRPAFYYMGGGTGVTLGAFLFFCLVSSGARDSSLNQAGQTEYANWLGAPGAIIADVSLQLFGHASLVPALLFINWGVLVFIRRAPLSLMLHRFLTLGPLMAGWALVLESTLSQHAAKVATAATPLGGMHPGGGAGGAIGSSLHGLLHVPDQQALYWTGLGLIVLPLLALTLWHIGWTRHEWAFLLARCARGLWGLSRWSLKWTIRHPIAYVFRRVPQSLATPATPATAGTHRPAQGFMPGPTPGPGTPHATEATEATNATGLPLDETPLFPEARASFAPVGPSFPPGPPTPPLGESGVSWDSEDSSAAAPVSAPPVSPPPVSPPPGAEPKVSPRARFFSALRSGPPASGFTTGAPDAPVGAGSVTSLLNRAPGAWHASVTESYLVERARTLEQVLRDYGIQGEIMNVRPGPIVTLFELLPVAGTKASRVITLAEDIARSLCAVSVRIATVPGEQVLGIEIPNQDRMTVLLGDIYDDPAWQNYRGTLPIALGRRIDGTPILADLATMPHLLIAGTTGSGKSVGVNAMILSLLSRFTAESCRMIMIDPKMLEFSVYDGIPHLLTPVVTDPHKAVQALKWAVREMESRYRLMARAGVRNIANYNDKIREGSLFPTLAPGERPGETVSATAEPHHPLPFLIIIVDELADLMLVAGKELEALIQRLAQMARAAGLHLIMATQRPSVDVITGTIKANFPTRMSYQVTSKIDSRTILGEQGAEALLGRGDMLFMRPGQKIERVHGPLVSDEEVSRICTALRASGEPNYVEGILEDPETAADRAGSGRGVPGDETFESGDLYEQALELVRRTGRTSTSFVQRQLQIGYNRAARLIERMEKEGVLSPANATGKRELIG